MPTLTTTEVTGITAHTAISGGVITDDAGSTITARGVCWSTETDPTVTDSKTVDGAGGGTYSSTLIDLLPNTTYFVRAYVTNANGTGYGMTLSFTTLDGVSSITTGDASEITATSAQIEGNVNDDGGSEVTGRGVCWSLSENPTLNDSYTTDGSGLGSFTSNLTGLIPGSTYYARAYAINSVGTSYGNQISFSTLVADGTIGTVTYNAYTYQTVYIGGREWFAENLRTTQYNNGTPIPTGFSNNDWSALTTGAYAIYPHSSIDGLNSEAEVLEAYGALYNWYAVNTGNLCPTGWYVPTDADWVALTDYVDGGIDAGTKLKATSGWNSGGNGTDEYGFSALPGGFRSGIDGGFFNVGYDGYWWSSTEHDASRACRLAIFNIYGSVNYYTSYKSDGISVRCVRDTD